MSNFVGDTLTFYVKPSDTILKVKAQIMDQEGLKSLKFGLTNGTKILDNDLTVSYYKMKKSQPLSMLKSLKGGGEILILSWKSFMYSFIVFYVGIISLDLLIELVELI